MEKGAPPPMCGRTGSLVGQGSPLPPCPLPTAPISPRGAQGPPHDETPSEKRSTHCSNAAEDAAEPRQPHFPAQGNSFTPYNPLHLQVVFRSSTSPHNPTPGPQRLKPCPIPPTFEHNQPRSVCHFQSNSFVGSAIRTFSSFGRLHS
jgi:hypothetical protein